MSENKVSAQEVIALVMQEVQSLAKKDKNTAQGFVFRGIDAVMNAVGPALRKHGGFIMPNLDNVEYAQATSAKGGNLNIARVTVTYVVYGSDGSNIAGSVCAEAFDSGDKATAKAMSVAYRTFLLQLLCLPTDEPDPDTYSYETATPNLVDWVTLTSGLSNVDEARELWTQAKTANASKDILKAIEAKAEELG